MVFEITRVKFLMETLHRQFCLIVCQNWVTVHSMCNLHDDEPSHSELTQFTLVTRSLSNNLHKQKKWWHNRLSLSRLLLCHLVHANAQDSTIVKTLITYLCTLTLFLSILKTRTAVSVLKQDPNTWKVKKNSIRTNYNMLIFGVISFIKLQNDS